MTFGQKLRMMRAKAGLSQTQLTQQTGIDRRYIGLIEADRMIPSEEWIDKIRLALGWDAASDHAFALLTGETEKGPA